MGSRGTSSKNTPYLFRLYYEKGKCDFVTVITGVFLVTRLLFVHLTEPKYSMEYARPLQIWVGNDEQFMNGSRDTGCCTCSTAPHHHSLL